MYKRLFRYKKGKKRLTVNLVADRIPVPVNICLTLFSSWDHCLRLNSICRDQTPLPVLRPVNMSFDTFSW